MEKKKITKKNISKKTKNNVNKKVLKNKEKGKRIQKIIVIDYTFLVSLVLTVIFGVQTNGTFLLPFTITLVITIVCMCIILINSIYNIIRKKYKK